MNQSNLQDLIEEFWSRVCVPDVCVVCYQRKQGKTINIKKRVTPIHCRNTQSEEESSPTVHCSPEDIS